MTLNFAANGLGLDNAATPMGLKAIRALQELNPSSTTASNAQILFLVLNASSLTLLPVSIFMYRLQQGAASDTPSGTRSPSVSWAPYEDASAEIFITGAMPPHLPRYAWSMSAPPPARSSLASGTLTNPSSDTIGTGDASVTRAFDSTSQNAQGCSTDSSPTTS